MVQGLGFRAAAPQNSMSNQLSQRKWERGLPSTERCPQRTPHTKTEPINARRDARIPPRRPCASLPEFTRVYPNFRRAGFMLSCARPVKVCISSPTIYTRRCAPHLHLLVQSAEGRACISRTRLVDVVAERKAVRSAELASEHVGVRRRACGGGSQRRGSGRQ